MSDENRKVDDAPHLAAEVALLGCMMLSGEARDGVPRMVGPGDFEREAHRVLFEALVRMHRAGEVVDHITVGAELHHRDQLDVIGGLTALYAVSDPSATPSPASWPTYATLVAREGRRRRTIRSLFRAIRSLEAGEDPAVVSERLTSELEVAS